MEPQNPSMEEPQQQNPEMMLFIELMSKRRTWASLFILVYSILLYSSWNLLYTILTWYTSSSSPSPPAPGARVGIYAPLMLGAVFGVMSMVAALAVAIRAMLVTSISVLVLLAFCGVPTRFLVVEGTILAAHILGNVVRILVEEGYLVAVVCVVFGFFLVRGGFDVT